MSITYRPLKRVDVPQLLGLLQQDRPGIAGLSNERVYRAVLRDCLRSRNLLCVVATRDAAVFGYVLAARNWKRFQWTFALRHPVLAAEALARRARRPSHARTKGRAQPAPGDSLATTYPQDGASDKREKTCHILYIGVDRRQRSQGVGSGLYAALRTHLEQCGFHQIQAHIAEQNSASLRLHERTGWAIMKRPDGGYRATLSLKRQN